MPRHGDLYAQYQAGAEEDLQEAYTDTPASADFHLRRAQVRATLAAAEAQILAARIIRGQKDT